jgi:DNA-binding IclR family transcriptional regulator
MVEQSKTVDKSLDVLWSLRDDGPASASSLARRLEASRTVVLRLLSSLESKSLVRRAEGEYRLGYGLVELAAGIDSDLRHEARRSLEALFEAFNETVVIAVRDGNEVVVIDQIVPDDRIVTVRYATGVRHPVGRGAHGVALDGDFDGTYACTSDELERDVSGLAAPIRDSRGRVVAAIGIVAPSRRFPNELDAAKEVVNAAAEIGRRLGVYEAKDDR